MLGQFGRGGHCQRYQSLCCWYIGGADDAFSEPGKIDGTKATAVAVGFSDKLNEVPRTLRLSMTYDQVKEMVKHAYIAQKTWAAIYLPTRVAHGCGVAKVVGSNPVAPSITKKRRVALLPAAFFMDKRSGSGATQPSRAWCPVFSPASGTRRAQRQPLAPTGLR